MTDRPGGQPDHWGHQPDDSTWVSPPRDDQWTSVDGPPDPYAYPLHPETGYGYPPREPYPPNPYGNQYQPWSYPADQTPGGGATAPLAPPGGPTSRTLWLITAVVASLVVIVLVAGYFLVRGSDDVAAPAASGVQTTDDLLAPTEESTPQTAGPGAAQPSAAPAAGQVLYSLSGNGQILGLTYSAGNTIKISPRLISPPWAVATDVQGSASLTAVVLQGRVTCTITLDGRVLDRSSSSTGLLRCEAPAR